ncbi:YigZ family protein [Marinobacter orientalis]|uniref:YigZ family protein n=1 Tax=Marinobacter orientalis TaxID=1928859 RepID=A0A7Y0RE17_9GAMM|nr:YigZ family protein [Marinobacter orientalis]NMT64515.1 YigZ family protein [Marinobacter orientalis]TGX50530.1 YigZ family protein [Marinobacter orientalis]
MSRNYPVPAGFLERETEVKKSRFIARVAPVSSRDEVKARLEQAHKDHPDARHICWAYQIGRPGAAAEAGMNDDGEPSGTAGKPILSVIQHKDMGDVLVLVIRYFGGIKLGAGGLVRAYAGATEAVLSAVERVIQPPTSRVTITMTFADEQPLRHWCEQNEAQLDQVDYGSRVVAGIAVPVDRLNGLSEFCDARGIGYSLEN